MRASTSTIVAASFVLLSPAAARAGGLLLPGSGAVSTARAGASVASIDDASAIGINPAQLAGLHGWTVTVGAAFINYDMTFQRTGVYETDPDPAAAHPWDGQPYPSMSDESKPPIGFAGFQAVPVIAVAKDIPQVKGLVASFGIFAPNAYPVRSFGADYTIEQPGVPPPPTRYDLISQEAAIVLPSIAVAYRINNKIDLGARFSSGFASLKAKTFVWGLDNLQEDIGKDGLFTVNVKDNFVPAFGAGATFHATPNIDVAAAWSSGYTVDGKGTGTSQVGSRNQLTGAPIMIVPNDERARCAKGGTAEALKACVKVQLPWTAQVGGRYVFRDDAGKTKGDVELDLDYEHWAGGDKATSQVSDYEVIVDGIAAVDVGPPIVGLDLQVTRIRHNLQDTYGARLGGSWRFATGFGGIIARGGVAYDSAAAKKNWERLDLDGAARTTATVGASLDLKAIRVDVGGGYVYEGTRTQGTGCNPQVIMEGCTPGSTQDPINNRPGPDPVQPTKDQGGQQESPFNEGTLKSGYVLFTLGVSKSF